MKRILCNNYFKFAVFILCALAVAVSAFKITDTFVREDVMYLFEESYEESHMAAQALKMSFYSIISELVATEDSDNKLHLDRIRIQEHPMYEYYIKVNDDVYSNAEGMTYDDFRDSTLAAGCKSENMPREDFFKANGWSSIRYIETADSYEVAIRMKPAAIEENAAKWSKEKLEADDCAHEVIILLIFALALFAYLLCATGRSFGRSEIQMMLIDRMFTELTAVLLGLVLIGGGALVVYGTGYFLIEEEILIVKQLVAPAVFAVVSVSMLLCLSLVRNLKNRTFMERSLTVRAWRLCVRIIKWTVTAGWRMLKRICGAIADRAVRFKRTVFRFADKNFSGRFVGILVGLFAVCIAILAALTVEMEETFILLIIAVAAAVIFVNKRVMGFNELKDGIEKIKNGDLNHKITDCPDGVISEMADNVNSIGDGLSKSLEREVKAERMKSELITNVSHDLKTPLTSIINYAELLSKETLLPEEANDYVKIILQKGERLKQLTGDLFDISKVQSGNETFDTEDIDICLLVNQAMAEINERITQAGLAFKLTASDKEIMIKGDGKKLSRVFENLFVNCAKYAMPNTRVYIDITETSGGVTVEIKNIAGYEMDFDETEIAERFVRGDKARSSEGSGLGLAIVKSYVEGCGGNVIIKKDGDLFKVILSLRKSQ